MKLPLSNFSSIPSFPGILLSPNPIVAAQARTKGIVVVPFGHRVGHVYRHLFMKGDGSPADVFEDEPMDVDVPMAPSDQISEDGDAVPDARVDHLDLFDDDDDSDSLISTQEVVIGLRVGELSDSSEDDASVFSASELAELALLRENARLRGEDFDIDNESIFDEERAYEDLLELDAPVAGSSSGPGGNRTFSSY